MSDYLRSKNIYYRRIPHKVLRKAERILQQIEQGAYWGSFGGHRLNHDRNKIAVPVGRKWRLVGTASSTGVTFTEIMSHERFNNCA